MHSRLLLAAFVGTIAFLSLASAQSNTNSYYGNQPSGSCYDVAQSAGPIYTRFPLNDKFPNTQQGSLESMDLADRADGIPPNSPLPNYISQDTITSLRVATHYSYYGIAYFTQLQNYITGNKPGFSIEDYQEREYVVEALTSIIAQTEQNTLTTISIFQSFGVEVEQPCTYQLPPVKANDYTSYISLAAWLTDIYNGFVQSFIQRAAQAGDVDFVLQFSAAAQSVAQRVGVFRSLLGYTPAANPFITFVSREITYSTLVNYLIVPGSCPNVYNIDLALFAPLYIPQLPLQCNGVDQILTIVLLSTDIQAHEGLHIAYGNQQNSPVVVPIENIYLEDGCVTIEAVFPCSLPTFGIGETTVSLVNNSGPFKFPDELTPYTRHSGGFYLA